MTGMTRMTGMTWWQGSYPVLNKKFKDFLRTFQGQISYSSRIPIIALRMSFLVLPQHDCKFNFYPEGLSVFAPFMHLRIWVG